MMSVNWSWTKRIPRAVAASIAAMAASVDAVVSGMVATTDVASFISDPGVRTAQDAGQTICEPQRSSGFGYRSVTVRGPIQFIR